MRNLVTFFGTSKSAAFTDIVYFCYAAQVLRSKYDKINVENSELLMQNINMHIQITIHTHYVKSSSSSRSDSSDSPGFLEI